VVGHCNPTSLLDIGTLPNAVTETTNCDNADQVSLLSRPHWPSGHLRCVSEMLPRKIPGWLQVTAQLTRPHSVAHPLREL
jgi:hypothetical protein